jgi:Tfp pilus assembly protein PilO
MKFPKDKRIYFTAVLTGIVVLLFLWLAFFWQGKKVREKAEAYQKEKLNVLVLEEKKKRLSQLRKEVDNLEGWKDKLNAMFVKKDEAVPLIKRLEKAAENTSCAISIEPADLSKIKFEKINKKSASASSGAKDEDEDGVKNKSEAVANDPKKQPQDELAELKKYPAFSVSASGSFSSVVDFLEKVENLPYFIRPLVIDVSSENKKGAAPTTGAGSLDAGGEKNAPEEGGKNVKMSLIIVVYGE